MDSEESEDGMISSTGNGKIKELVRIKKSSKERTKRGVFLVEGVKMFREIPRGLCLEVYASEMFLQTAEGETASAYAREWGCSVEVVSDSVFQYLSDTQSPQGILAVVRQMKYELKDLMAAEQADVEGLADAADQTDTAEPADTTDQTDTAEPADTAEPGKVSAPLSTGKPAPLIVVLENLQDPGNLGTIIRTAEAAGASGILLSKGCADFYNPKVTRSTMGSIFRVPFVYTDDLKGALLQLKGQGIRMLAAHLKGSVDLYEESFVGPTALLIGNESRGLTDETAALADQAIRIPMSGSVESLNAAVAAAVCMFEAKRQRRSTTCYAIIT